jgi:catechol 2,3-dioxygenase-like lactoylglutathione lyase family enzyme
MANERMYPILPCREIDEAISFYETLGFRRTYRQLRPNPCAVVALEDMHIHLAGIDGFKPEDSYASVIIVVPDPDALYRSFSEKLKEKYKKLPVAGIPRILRPRKKFGTVSGFSVVDPGGNWLRIYKLGDSEEGTDEKVEGLTHYINLAARLGDAKGDVALALKTLESGIAKFPEALPVEKVRAYLYRAELAIRVSRPELAASSLAEAKSIQLSKEDAESLEEELTHVEGLVRA